jgi:alcohol dehydrogenase (NADP+)
MRITAYGAHDGKQPLAAMKIDRRAVGVTDVEIDILFCGVCHTDLHQARDDWGNTRYPCVPGHEIVGRVSAIGEKTTRHRVGDIVGVGCMVNSCRRCDPCAEGLEQFCAHGFTGTYNASTQDPLGYTLGGYSRRIVVDENYVLRIAHPGEQLAAVAPLLCAGITTYSALRNWKVGPSTKVGIVGIGGLGHVGIKIARALGARVVAFTTSESKRGDGRALGADDVVVSRNKEEMAAHAESFDFILNTVAASHNLDDYLVLLKRDCTMAMVGAPDKPHPGPSVPNLFRRRRSLSGSLIGGIAETQEMLDFCAKRNIVADVEIIAASQINVAFERMHNSDVKYRFVIDIATMAV